MPVKGIGRCSCHASNRGSPAQGATSIFHGVLPTSRKAKASWPGKTRSGRLPLRDLALSLGKLSAGLEFLDHLWSLLGVPSLVPTLPWPGSHQWDFESQIQLPFSPPLHLPLPPASHQGQGSYFSKSPGLG